MARKWPGSPDLTHLTRYPLLSSDFRSGLVTVVVSVPDWDALGAVEEPLMWHRFLEVAVIARLDYYVHMCVEAVPGFDTIAHPQVSG